MKTALLVVTAGICVVSAGSVLAQTSVMEVKEDLKVDTDTLYVDAANNRVGIGTSSPEEVLHIDGSVRGNQSGALRVSTGNGYIDIGPQNTSYAHIYTDRPRLIFNKEVRVNTGLIGSHNQDLSLRTYGTTRMTLLRSNGNVGIASAGPAARLEVRSEGTAKDVGTFCRSNGNMLLQIREGGDGNAVFNLYESDGTTKFVHLQPDFDSYYTGGGQFGIGTTNPTETLDVNGAIRLRAMATPPSGTGNASLYAKDIDDLERLCARDESGNDTVLSSHRDPQEVDSEAASSFADGNIPLPFSFSHSNAFIGKGAVVDMAALVAKVEEMAGESFTHGYSLPAEEILNVAEWQRQRQAQLEKEAKEQILAQEPEVEIPIGQAWELVEEQVAVDTIQSTTRYIYDLDTEEVTLETLEEPAVEWVGTGVYERRLKAGVRFEETTGRFYRARTLDDIEVEPVPPPELPEWVAMRLP